MTRTKMTPEEKKARAEAKKQSNLSITGRATFKASGAVLFGVEDRRGAAPVIMHLTMIDGRITSCVDAATGDECEGRHWSGHCCHETRVMAYESERAEALHEAAQVAPALLGESFAADLTQHVEDETRQESGVSDAIASIEAKRAAWQQATEEQKRNWFCDEFDIYGAA